MSRFTYCSHKSHETSWCLFNFALKSPASRSFPINVTHKGAARHRFFTAASLLIIHNSTILLVNCFCLLAFTVQAIRNITNFRAKNSHEFANFVLKFVHEIREKSSTNSCLKIAFLRKRYGEKYQYHQYYLRCSMVEFYCMGRHWDMLISSKAISYSKLFNKLCVRTQAFRNINFIDQGF